MMFRSLVLSCSLLGFLANGAVMAMEEEDNSSVKIQSKLKESPRALDPFDFEETFPEEMQELIVQQVVFNHCLEDINPVNIALVCKKWDNIVKEEMKVGKAGWKARHGVVGHEDIYQRFLKGEVVYRPDPNSDEGMITLKISDLPNPLEGTFDLSKCGESGKYLSIATGYRKGQTLENANKVEIWVTPRFLVDKKMPSLAKNHHLRALTETGAWDGSSPVEILWTCGWWDAVDQMSYCDYLTTDSLAKLESEDLATKYQKSRAIGRWTRIEVNIGQKNFTFRF